MTDTYNYVQHQRVTERAEQGPPTVHKVAAKLHGGAAISRFNGKIGLGITRSVGTMWAAYAFTAITLVSLPAALMTGSPIVIVAWIAQTFLQLVLLPVIIVGQNIQAAAADARSAATYEDAGAILDEAKQIQVHLASQDAAISTLLDKMLVLESALQSKPAP
ncbi:MAG: hypothetical protein ACYCZY_12760 [Lacisediminihabitans sp.]